MSESTRVSVKTKTLYIGQSFRFIRTFTDSSHIKKDSPRHRSSSFHLVNDVSLQQPTGPWQLKNIFLLFVRSNCDNRSKSVVNEDYQNVIDDIEHVLLSLDYDSAIIYGDFNTCLNRNNAHSLLLTQFTVRNVLYINVWNHPKAKQDDTYINTALNQRSRIDHA